MAKFAIFLCIVAFFAGAGNTQSTSLSITSGLTTLLTTITSTVETQQDTLQENISSAQKSVATFTQEVVRAVSYTITKYVKHIENITTNAIGEVSSCTTIPSINIEETAMGIASDAIVCARENLNKLLSQGKTILAGIEDLMNVLTYHATAAAACASDIPTFPFCIRTSVWASLGSHIATIWTTRLAEITDLNSQLSIFEVSLASCDIASRIANLTDIVQDSIAGVEKCVANLSKLP